MMSLRALAALRRRLERAWGPETIYAGSVVRPTDPVSRGQCAPTAEYIQHRFGGKLVGARIRGERHIFNRVGNLDIDLTADQYGGPKVATAPAGKLWPDSRVLPDRKAPSARCAVLIRKVTT
jgi:hypothetical protein